MTHLEAGAQRRQRYSTTVQREQVGWDDQLAVLLMFLSVAATLLGEPALALFLAKGCIHLSGKESIDDTSRVLSRICGIIIMARTNSP
ncbi:hypothetical protein O9992_24300 [Vibrio lentus]|nr:hypothetical protein [Vibrio lentus]